ncbi:hypothetical protein Sjap_010823 [Stephania japonica]|uniref:Pentatricopeptide repeat-containing protein n=1 Tax=Stephania japonica TaxID=461633 RepID=A0AAP0JC68_9MAGN
MICKTINLSTTPAALRTRSTFISLISKSSTTQQLNEIHSQLILNALHTHPITLTALIQKLSDLGSISHAHTLFSTIPSPDLFLHNVLIRALSRNRRPSSAIALYARLRPPLLPCNFTYAFAASACASMDSVEFGRLVHAHATVAGCGGDVFVGSAFVDLYFKFGCVGDARKVFDEMPEPDTVCWNAMISGLSRNGRFREALEVFGEMVGRGVSFDSTSLAAVIRVAGELMEVRVGLGVHCMGIKSGLCGHGFVLTGLVSLYSKCGDVDTARFLFEQIERPDFVSWNAMISGYSCNGETESAVRLFRELTGSGGEVTSSTIVGLLPVFSPFGHLELCRCIHGFAVKAGVDSNVSVSTALTTVYSRLNEIEFARQIFNEAPEKSLESWNAIISGYTQNGLTEMAISIFRRMQTLKVQPNPVTITSILSACAQLGAVTLGKWVHELIVRENFQSNIYVSTALIDMYAKCGSIKEAQILFDTMPEKNVVSWNAMISGYGLHGLGHEALRLFDEMSKAGVSPNGVTFLAALHACSHAGLVREGEKIFQLMSDYGITRGPEHYACLVDLFGRAGRLEEALEFIKGMPVEPGPAEWGALLGACMVHKNKTLAQIASDNLFKLDSESVGYHVLLSNIHSSDGNYQRLPWYARQ